MGLEFSFNFTGKSYFFFDGIYFSWAQSLDLIYSRFFWTIFLERAMKGSSMFSEFFTDIIKYETPFFELHYRIYWSDTAWVKSALFPIKIIYEGFTLFEHILNH